MKRKQMMYKFHTKEAADLFEEWLKKNVADRDYGCVQFQGRDGNNVGYAAESNFAQGVAIGIDMCEKVRQSCL